MHFFEFAAFFGYTCGEELHRRFGGGLTLLPTGRELHASALFVHSFYFFFSFFFFFLFFGVADLSFSRLQDFFIVLLARDVDTGMLLLKILILLHFAKGRIYVFSDLPN